MLFCLFYIYVIFEKWPPKRCKMLNNSKKKKEKAVRNCTLLDNATHQRHHVARVSVFNTLIHNEEDSAKEKKRNKEKKEQKATAYCKSNGLTPKKTNKQTNKQTKKKLTSAFMQSSESLQQQQERNAPFFPLFFSSF